MDPRELAASIDHTLLKPNATADAIRHLCAEVRRFLFASVCVNPYWVRLALDELAESGVAVAVVTGFPLGASETAAKVFEAERAIGEGAREIDMVMNVGELTGGNPGATEEDIRAVVVAAHNRGASVKVIL